MTAKFKADGLHLTADLLDYVRTTTVRETEVQVKIRLDTATMDNARMMISPEQGHAMRTLLRLVRPRRIVEVGVFTGYSATWLVDALEPGGELIACDINPVYVERARSYWREAGIDDAIRVHLGPAAESLQNLLSNGLAGSVDAMFVDADKEGYDRYLDLGLELLRPGGVLMFDNILWSGRVIDDAHQDDDTIALRALAHRVGDDETLQPRSAILTDGDGILMVVK